MRFLLVFVILSTCLSFNAQQLIPENLNNQIDDFALRMNKDSISWNDLIDSIENYNSYSEIPSKGIEYIYYHNDTITKQDIPVRVYIPNNYNPKERNKVAIYFRGAEKLSSWDQIDRRINKYVDRDSLEFSNNPIVNHLVSQDDQIVIRVISDGEKGFCFAVNCDEEYPVSFGPAMFDKLLSDLKSILNIDDDHISVWGHSDGADAAYLMASLVPSKFNTFNIYNSMLSQVFGQTYIGNLVNRPIYIIHSDLDELRKVSITRKQIELLDSLNHQRLIYKEYSGYTHDDDHLELDLLSGIRFTNSFARNPYPTDINWETDSNLYDRVDWLKIEKLTVEDARADWHKMLNVTNEFYWKDEKVSQPYYQFKYKSGKAIAEYRNNKFKVKTSNVQRLTIMLFPHYIDYNKPVVIEVNGVKVYEDLFVVKRGYILESFMKHHDRSQIWIGEIVIDIP